MWTYNYTHYFTLLSECQPALFSLVVKSAVTNPFRGSAVSALTDIRKAEALCSPNQRLKASTAVKFMSIVANIESTLNTTLFQ